MEKKNYCKSLIGKKAVETKRPDRVGVLKRISFSSRDYAVCWFSFSWEKGEYMVSLAEIKILDSTPVQLKLF